MTNANWTAFNKSNLTPVFKLATTVGVLLLLNTKANGHNTISSSIEHANGIAKKEEDDHVRIVAD